MSKESDLRKEAPAKEEIKKEEEKKPVELSGKKEKAADLPRLNEEVFRKGDKVELSKLPFVVDEVHGLKLVLKRSDIA